MRQLTLADAGPPNVLQGARSLAVDTLDLVCIMLLVKLFVTHDYKLPAPMMTFLRVAPLAREKTASESPPSA